MKLYKSYLKWWNANLCIYWPFPVAVLGGKMRFFIIFWTRILKPKFFTKLIEILIEDSWYNEVWLSQISWKLVEVFSFYDWLNYDLRCTFLCTDAVAGSRLTLNSPSPWKRMGCLIECRSKNPASISTKFGYLTLWCIKYVCIKSKVCRNIFFDKKDTFWEKNTKNVLYFVKVATYSVTNTPYFYHLAKTSITHDLTKNDTEMITLL